MRFRDRADAGRRLATLLLPFRGHDTRVFGLNGGGVRVAFEAARTLEAHLDVWVAREVEVPGRPGSRMGAVAEGEGYFLNAEAVRSAAAPASELTRLMEGEAGEVALEAHRLRGGHPRMPAGAGTALLVVEGIAAGALAVYAALRGLRRQQPRQLVLAAPLAAMEELEPLRLEVDELLCLQPVWALLSVEGAYDDFRSLPDIEVRQLMERARELRPERAALGTDRNSEWM